MHVSAAPHPHALWLSRPKADGPIPTPSRPGSCHEAAGCTHLVGAPDLVALQRKLAAHHRSAEQHNRQKAVEEHHAARRANLSMQRAAQQQQQVLRMTAGGGRAAEQLPPGVSYAACVLVTTRIFATLTKRHLPALTAICATGQFYRPCQAAVPCQSAPRLLTLIFLQEPPAGMVRPSLSLMPEASAPCDGRDT